MQPKRSSFFHQLCFRSSKNHLLFLVQRRINGSVRDSVQPFPKQVPLVPWSHYCKVYCLLFFSLPASEESKTFGPIISINNQ